MNTSKIFRHPLRLAAVMALSISTAQAGSLCVSDCTTNPVPPPTDIGSPGGFVPFSASLLSGAFETNSGMVYAYNVFDYSTNPVNSLTLPYFADEQISSINTPANWSFEIGNTDIFGLGQGAGYMRWFYTGALQSYAGSPNFSFQSPLSPGLSPYNFTQLDGSVFNGVNTEIPLSALAMAAGLVAPPTSVPVPAALPQFLGGLALMLTAIRRRAGTALGCADSPSF